MPKKKVNIFGTDIDQDKVIIGAAVGAVVLAGIGYLLSGSSSEKKASSSSKPRKTPSAKLTQVFKTRFEDVNICPGEDLQNCHITSDQETLSTYKKLKAGAQLIKLNNEKVAGLPFREILQKIETAATPITAHFLENPALEETWTKAETLKEEANKLNKDKSDPNRYQKALDLYSQAISLHPTRKEYYGNRVLMYFGKKEFDAALADCEKFQPFDPHQRWQRGMHLRGLVYNYLQRYEPALECFEQVVAIDPSGKMATKARARINTLKAKLANDTATDETPGA